MQNSKNKSDEFEKLYQDYLNNKKKNVTRDWFLKNEIYKNKQPSKELLKYVEEKNNKNIETGSDINNNYETSNGDTEKKEENPKLAEIKEIKRMLSDGNADNNKEALERMLKLFKDAEPNEKVSKEKIEQDKKKIEDDLIDYFDDEELDEIFNLDYAS